MSLKHQNLQAAPQGGIVEMEAPIHVSNVMVVDSTGVAGRVGYKEVDGKKSVFLKPVKF